MFKVNSYPDTSVTGEQDVYITCSREDAAQLLMWLNRVNTGFMNDQQFMYFCRFKDKLQEVKQDSNLQIPTVQDWYKIQREKNVALTEGLFTEPKE